MRETERERESVCVCVYVCVCVCVFLLLNMSSKHSWLQNVGYKKPGKPPKPVGQREWTPTAGNRGTVNHSRHCASDVISVGGHTKQGYVSQVGGEGEGPPPPKRLEDLP